MNGFVGTIPLCRKMKNLAEVPKKEQLDFINSFDHLLCDLDGVIWIHRKPIPGASACINSLKQLGRKVHFVSNNSTVPIELVQKVMAINGLDTDIEDIIVPIEAIVSYLKKIKFNKELYVIGLSSVKDTLRKAGFSVTDGPQEIEESIAIIIETIADDKNVGGVLVELDMNINFIKLQKAVTYLRREDCIFIAAAADAQLPNGQHGSMIGPHYFLKPLIDLTGREPYQIAKPSLQYNEFVVDRFKITDPDRVLFVGDSVKEDLNFATKCGYKKLLVLSGITTKEQLSRWEYPEEYKPQYYVDSLGTLNDIIYNCSDSLNKESLVC